MTAQNRMDDLLARLPELARASADTRIFWREVDAEMEAICAEAESPDDQRAVDDRYRALLEKADLLGMCQED